MYYREARCDLLHLHLGSTGVSLTDKDYELLSEKTEGYSGSDICHVISDALLLPVRELVTTDHWVSVNGLLQPCSHNTSGAIQATISHLPPHQVLLSLALCNNV